MNIMEESSGFLSEMNLNSEDGITMFVLYIL